MQLVASAPLHVAVNHSNLSIPKDKKYCRKMFVVFAMITFLVIAGVLCSEMIGCIMGDKVNE